jgi:SAM-dependent methyltransferase
MEIEYTGEFVVPGKVPPKLWQEHINRYSFASQLVQGKACLDVACGTGYGTALLAQRCDTVIGVDLKEQALKHAKYRYDSRGVEFIEADAEALPFGKETFDCVVSFETIEHLERPAKFLSECRRVLRDYGLFICSTPNGLVFRSMAEFTNPFHVQEFSPRTFISLIKQYFADTILYGQTYWRRGKLIRLGLRILSLFSIGDSMSQGIRRPLTIVTPLPKTSSSLTGDDKYGISLFRDRFIWTQADLIAVGRKLGREHEIGIPD